VSAWLSAYGATMAGKITALAYQKRNMDRVNVYLDGKFAFGLAAIEAARLHVGQTLSDEEISKLRMRDDIERAHGRALDYLSYRPRSESEVRHNLSEKDVEDQIVDVVVERLKRAGLLDDREFARYWVKNRARFNPRGLRGLRYEMQQKGVSRDIIDDALETFDVEAAARKTAEAGARRLSHEDSSAFRRKLQAYMVRRGFSYAVIQPLVEEMVDERRCEEDTESEGR
jgi:regulatory protein